VTPAGHDAVVALVTHARQVPAADRERFAARLRNRPDGQSLVLETCHRVEAYLVLTGDDARVSDYLPAGGRLLSGEAAVRHAIAVAAGRDSVVIGEDQILHQLRESVDEARGGDRLHPVLERLFSFGLRAGRRARSWREGPPLSLADVALAAIARRGVRLDGREVLVVGAGKMGRLSARAAAAAGAQASIANRSPERAVELASSAGARVEAFDPGPAIDRFAAVVVALGGPWIIADATAASLADGSSIVVDLSVPVAVPASLAELLGPRLITADDLAQAELERDGANDRSLARLDALIDDTTSEFLAWLDLRDGRAAAAALTARAEVERSDELDQLWRRLPGLDPEARDAIERMSEHLARRLLREPLARLGRDADGRQERAARELFDL
jgi:glutamyl-tRNA reductase